MKSNAGRWRQGIATVLFLTVMLAIAIVPSNAGAAVGSDSAWGIDDGDRIEDLNRGTVGGRVVIEQGETVTGGLDAVGSTVVVRGTVQGDLNAAGGTIVVADTGLVTRDVEAAGGTVDIARNARIGGDVEAAGGTVMVDGTVQGDVTVGAGSVTLGPTATIECSRKCGTATELGVLDERKRASRAVLMIAFSEVGSGWQIASQNLVSEPKPLS